MATKVLTVTLYKSEIMYNVKNNTYLTGKSRDNGQNMEQVANMQAGDDASHENQIIRSMDGAFAELKSKVSQYLASTSAASASDNIQKEATGTGNTTYVLALNMPGNFNDAVKDTISAACHKYITNTAISDWYVITKPDEAASYLTLATTALQTIREALNKRISPTRVTPVV